MKHRNFTYFTIPGDSDHVIHEGKRITREELNALRSDLERHYDLSVICVGFKDSQYRTPLVKERNNF